MAEIPHLSFLWKILISIGRLCTLLPELQGLKDTFGCRLVNNTLTCKKSQQNEIVIVSKLQTWEQEASTQASVSAAAPTPAQEQVQISRQKPRQLGVLGILRVAPGAGHICIAI